MDSSSATSSSLDPATWVESYGDSLYRYALSRLRNAEAAEEVVQDTFVAALAAVDQFSGKGAEGAWLLGILKRKIVDFVRARNRNTSATDDEDPTNLLFDEKGNWRSDPRIFGTQPEALLQRAEFWQILRQCLSGLSQRQADVFTLREMEGISSETICKELDLSSSNLWVLLHRARLRLSACMKSNWTGDT